MDFNILKKFVAKGDPIKPHLDKIYVHHEYALASNGHFALKLNMKNDIDHPYLLCPKTRDTHGVGEFPIDLLLRLLDGIGSGDRHVFAHEVVGELIDAHELAKACCKRPDGFTTWHSGGIHAISKDLVCELEYKFPTNIKPFSYDGRLLLQILKTVKSFKRGCTMYPSATNPTLFEFGEGRRALLMPMRVIDEMLG